MDNFLPELDHIIFEFLQITDLINLLLINKKFANIIKQENRYKKYQEFYKKEFYKKEVNTFFIQPVLIFIDYFCKSCQYGDTEIIKYFINKYR